MKRYCSVEGCERVHFGLGYCSAHYRKFRLYGDPLGSAYGPKPPCSVDGCETTSYKKGLCNPHYIRQRRHGDVSLVKVTRRAEDGKCTVEGCDGDWLSRGYCKRHYERFMKYGDPLGEASRPDGCAVDGCYGVHKGRGYCVKHLRRLRLYGDPLGEPPRHIPYACKVDGCTDQSYAMDLCRSHYWIASKHGDPLAVPRRGKKSQPDRPPIECATCGREFNPGPSHLRKYCSRACRPSGKRKSTYTSRTVTLKLAKQDGWDCALCGTPVDSSYYFPHPLAPTVDHKIAVVSGGTDEWGNLQLAHFRCNVRRGATPL